MNYKTVQNKGCVCASTIKYYLASPPPPPPQARPCFNLKTDFSLAMNCAIKWKSACEPRSLWFSFFNLVQTTGVSGCFNLDSRPRPKILLLLGTKVCSRFFDVKATVLHIKHVKITMMCVSVHSEVNISGGRCQATVALWHMMLTLVCGLKYFLQHLWFPRM